MQDLELTRQQTEATRLQFIEVEFDLANTFLSIARETGLDQEKTRRNYQYARLAYETITRLMADADLLQDKRSELESRLQKIDTALQQVEL
jgi:hypothetical protein